MVHRGIDRWRELSDLCREGSPAHPSARRHRRHGQSRQPQRQDRASAHPFRRCQAVLPAKYSPDLNPIEQVFAKLKHLLRKLAARTVDAVCAAIGEVLTAFTSDECANYLKNAGYQT